MPRSNLSKIPVAKVLTGLLYNVTAINQTLGKMKLKIGEVWVLRFVRLQNVFHP